MPITTRAAGFAIAAIAVTTPAPALAGNAVYGGTTSAGAAIVINADKKAKKLRSAVVSWKASCDDGSAIPRRGAAEGGRRRAGLHARLPTSSRPRATARAASRGPSSAGSTSARPSAR